MLIQILRTVLIGAAIYFLGKVLKRVIDHALEAKNTPEEHIDADNMPERGQLVPCPKCGVYYNADNPEPCGLKNCPLEKL